MTRARDLGSQHDGTDPAWLPFRKSTFSAGGNCVEISISDVGDVRIRDSKLTISPELVFNRDEWTAFLLGVRAGEFELS